MFSKGSVYTARDPRLAGVPIYLPGGLSTYYVSTRALCGCSVYLGARM